MMLSLNVFTRTSPLCNRTSGVLIREKCIQRCLSLEINGLINSNRTLCFKVLDSSKVIAESNSKISQINFKNKYLYIRRVHTSSRLNCLSYFNEKNTSRNSNPRKSTTNVHDLFDQNEYTKDDGTRIEETSDDYHAEPAHHHKFQKEITLKEIEKMYPSPKSKLHEIYQLVNNDKKVNSLRFEYSKLTSKNKKSSILAWNCTVTVTWPEQMSFSSHASNKSSAASIAAWKCLQYLENQRKLKRGLPILYDSGGIQKLDNPVNLSVKTDTLYEAQLLLEKYDANIKPLIENLKSRLYRSNRMSFQTSAITDPVGKPNSNPFSRTPEKIEQRNELLKKRYEDRMSTKKYANLPILNFKDQIIDGIENNQVLLIKGDTGCGKTTQVPQYIMDYFAAQDSATNCNMLVAQPRRISATSLAERVAEERKETVGDVVGYQVRLHQILPNTPAGILFCTTGILLRKLQFNPTLEGCSHVIVDEAHERTINTDMLLVLLKRAMIQNPKLKVVVMSATINAELFQEYFNCKVIEVPGRTFPVEMNFLEHIDNLGLRAPNRWNMRFEDQEVMDNQPTTDIVKTGELISWICRNQPPGAILVFLPGWMEITLVKKYLEQYSNIPEHARLILPIHSKMSQFDQKKIFETPEPNVRKIVLATDIAETGITVTDVVYVVDSCLHKQVRWQHKRGVSSIDNYWISKANLHQRKGRAGRVKPGISYHFISRDKYASLDPYPIPEVKRSSLEKTVLDAKTYTNEKAVDFLTSMPQPPDTKVIAQAVDSLIELGALDDEENLTSLGKRIALFTVSPKLGKALVYSSIFQCISPIVTIASIMSSEHNIFSKMLYDKSGIRKIKSKYHVTSDHVALAWLYQQWSSYNNISIDAARKFCQQTRLYHERMVTLFKVRNLNAEHMSVADILLDVTDLDNMDAPENEYSQLDELVKGILLSGVDNILFQRNYEMRKGLVRKGSSTLIMEDGNRATLTPESVNFKRKQWPSRYLTYVGRTHSEERRTSLIRESSIVSPLTVFLFSQTQLYGHLHNMAKQNFKITTKYENEFSNFDELNEKVDMGDDGEEQMVLFSAKDRKNIKLMSDKPTADILINFRNAMWNVVQYMVDNYGAVTTDNTDTYEQINSFKVEMLVVLAKMLNEASAPIDSLEAANDNNNNDEDVCEDDDNPNYKNNYGKNKNVH